MEYNLHTISPYVRVAMDSLLPAGTRIGERVIFDYELLYIQEGTATVTVRDTVYQAVPGDIYLFRPKVPHSILVGKRPLRQPHIHFDLSYKPESSRIGVSFRPLSQIGEEEYRFFEPDVIDSFCSPLPDRIKLSDHSLFESRLFAIIREFDVKLTHYQIAAKGLLTELLVQLARDLRRQESAVQITNYDALLNAKAYMDTCYQTAITLEYLAGQAGLSRYYFSRLFESAFSLSPIRYLHSVRIQKAQEYLRFTDRPVGEIADMTGFDSVSVFIRAFKKAVGIPPGRYRNQKTKPAVL